MIKKIISVSLAFMMTFSLAPCSGPVRADRSRTDHPVSEKLPDTSATEEQSDVMFQVSLLQGLTFGDYHGSTVRYTGLQVTELLN